MVGRSGPTSLMRSFASAVTIVEMLPRLVPVEDEKKVVTNYRKPGNVVLAIGGAALIAGIVMIAVDVSKRKKARGKSQSGSKLRVQPYGAGIAF